MKKLIGYWTKTHERIDKYIQTKIEEDWRIEPAVMISMLILTYTAPHYIENRMALVTLIMIPIYVTTPIGLNRTIIPNEETRKKVINAVRLILLTTWLIAATTG